MAGSPVHEFLEPGGEAGDHGVDSDWGAGVVGFDFFPCAGVAEEEVWDELADGFCFGIYGGATG